ncbi:MAG: hypothetical protein AAF078_09175 [Planctomycetota bacterium]
MTPTLRTSPDLSSSQAPSLSGGYVESDESPTLLDSALPWLLAALLAAVLLRGALLWLGPVSGASSAVDLASAATVAQATAMADAGWYATPVDQPEPGAVAEAMARLGLSESAWSISPPEGLRAERFDLPGMATLIAGLSAVGVPMAAWPIAGACIAVLAMLLAYAAATPIWGKAGGAVAAWLVGLTPVMLIDPIALQPVALACLFALAGLALLADKRAGVLHGLIGGVSLGVASLVSFAMVLLGPVAAIWLLVRGRSVRAAGAGLALLITSTLPLAGWGARSFVLGSGPLPTVAPVVALMEAEAAVIEATTVVEEELAVFGPTADAVNLSAALHDGAVPDVAAEVDAATGEVVGALREIAGMAGTLASEPAATLGVMWERAVWPWVDDRSALLFGLLGLETQAGSSLDRWLAGDYLLQESPSPVADGAALLTVAASWAVLVLMPFGVAIGAWRRRWDGVVLSVLLAGAWFVGALVSATPEQTLPLGVLALGVMGSGLAADAPPRRARAPKAKRSRKAKAKADAAEPENQESDVLRAGPTVQPPAEVEPAAEPVELAREPETTPEQPKLTLVHASSASAEETAATEPAPIAAVPKPEVSVRAAEIDDEIELEDVSDDAPMLKPVAPEDRAVPRDDAPEEEPEAEPDQANQRLLRLPTVAELASAYDKSKGEVPPEPKPRTSGRPI